MARQTPFTSFNKRPRSIRLVLAELFSGRVSARLAELEERVFELEKRIDAQATAIANLGATVGMEKVRDSVASRVLRESRAHKESSHGKFSTKSTEANGLRSNFSNPGSGSRASRSESVDTGHNYFHHNLADDPLPERPPVSLDGMLLDTIPARPATPDLPSAVTEAIA
ncbi:TPA: hypothetical protein ACP4LD_004995 [Escherichia coli]|uniref:hypothetical protein n=1 Tax=Escherichia coli TaxID=562 RepID=UPI000A8C28EE|nr:hypothetical protein [Escherichia coli]MDC9110100.1 hypothetical protein [Escherichia coli]MDD8989993.1 hypothetical protein [Escherichia coli]MDD8995535.1 hypothetical protein [Escherichia coli]MDD9022446.1 hypothetical protein [Escherichia coli]MDD9035743.1 hypothetical protein [Escherichia coli]